MQKVLRIFSKDARHLWPEVLLTLGLTLAFAATEHLTWPAFFDYRQGFQQTQTLAIWMNILLPISWWLLIARAVHDESLVGDLQFWVTRPYGWPRLLAAKLLFLLTWIVVPFLLAQLFLLHQAGLHAEAVLPGLALKLLLLLGFVLLPLMALSTVTPSLTRMLLLFLAFIVYFALAAWIIGLIFERPYSPVPFSTGTDPWLYLYDLIPIAAIAVVFLQYARRQTTLSATLLLALIAILTVAASEETFGHRLKPSATPPEFPALAAGEAAPLHIAFDPAPPPLPPEDLETGFVPDDVSPNAPFVSLSIPLLVSGIAPGHAVRLEGGIIDAYLPGHPPKDRANWASVRLTPFLGSSTTPTESWHPLLQVQNDTFRAALQSHLAIHLTYAVTEYEPVATSTLTYRGGDLDLPQNGHCLNRNHTLYCQYALAAPAYTHVTWPYSHNCSGDMVHTRESWIGADDPSLTNAAFTPIVNSGSLFEQSTGYNQQHQTNEPCPNTPITFTRFKVLRHRLIDVTLPPIDPSLYLVKPRLRM